MKKKALFVGVNDYKDDEIRNLHYALDDARSLHDIFEELGYKTAFLKNPGQGEILSQVRRMIEGLSVGDQFVFYFSGHGFTDDGQHLLFCVDDVYANLRYKRAGMPFELLEEETRKCGCDRVFMLDACRSDFLTGTRGADTTTKDLCPISHMVPKAADATGAFYVLRSCSRYEHAFEIDKKQHGLFTLAMMEVIRESKNAGSQLLFNDMLRETVEERMSQIARNVGLSVVQTPESEVRGRAQILINGRNGFSGVSSHSVPSLVTCPICGKKNHPENTFKCRVCNRDNLCLRHQDEKTFLCADCAEKMARKAMEEVGQSHAEVQGQLLKTVPRNEGKEVNVITRKKTIRYMLTAFRDGFQCAMGGRVMSKHILPAVEAAYNAGVRWFEIGGGAIFQTSFFYCQQNAFDVMDSFRAICPDAELQTLSRGSNIVGLESQPADIIALYAMLFRKHGVSAIRNYDALYDPNNLKIPGQHIRKAGMIHEVALGIMGIPPKWNIGYVHTPEFYAERMRSFLDSGMPIDRVCIKDNSGTTSPDVVFNTVRQIRRLVGDKIHIQFHTHDSIGMGVTCCLAALKGGADGLDLSFAPLSGGMCQPDLIAMYQALQKNSEYRFDIDISKINKAVNEFKEAIKIYYISTEALAIDKKLIDIPVSGGTLVANMQMLADNGIDCPYEKLVPEFAECFKRGGCAVASMTPVSQFYVQQAAWNVAFGRFSRFVPGYAKLLLGYFGKLPVSPDPILVNAASSFLAANPTTSAYSRQMQRTVIELNNADQSKGNVPARRSLIENGLPITDENVFIAATCKEKGLQFLKGNGPMGCRFTDYNNL